MKKTAFLISFFACSLIANAQQVPANLWADIEKPATAQAVNRSWLPQQYRFMQLNINQLKQLISNAPDELNTTVAASNFIMALPMPDGSVQEFKMVYAPLCIAI
jgi:hypothetical protein